MRSHVIAGLLLVASLAHAQETPKRFWWEAWRGWHFYEEPELEPPDLPPPLVPREAPRQPAPTPPARPPELAEFERMQKALEESRSIAIARPTEANVRRYMELEAEVVAKASTFADVAQRVAWTSPELDPTLRGRPVNARALEVFEERRLAERSRSVAELGRDHVLVFFFRSDCPYCHAIAPTLQALQLRHRIRVEAVSVDGGRLPEFPDARPDNGVATALRVNQVPALYLAQPFTGRITPIGFGVLSEAQLLERIVAVAEPAFEAMVPSAVRHIAPR